MSLPFARAVNIPDIRPYDYSILILGETGVGKSTLLNTIINSILGNTVENLRVAIKCEKYPELNPEFNDNKFERNDQSSFISQTKNVHYYKASGSITNNKTILLVDTPGIASTHGYQEDDENTNEIIECAKHIEHFNAIIFMQKYSCNRTTQYFFYNVQRISEIIPRDFENSVIIVVSFDCGGGNTSNVEKFSFPFPVQKFFYFNNILFQRSKQEYLDKPEVANKINKKFIKIKKNASQMFRFIFNMNSISTTQYNELFVNHNGIMTKISEISTHLNNYKAIEEYLTNKTIIEVTRWIDTNYHNTICSLHNTICHENCFLNFTRVKESQYFNNCSCMNFEKKCKTCGCVSEQHLHKCQKPIHGPISIEEVYKYYNIPNSLKNEEKIKELINIKQKHLLLELQTYELLITEVNPRYKLSNHIRRAIDLMESTDCEEIKINDKKKESSLSLLKSLENLMKK